MRERRTGRPALLARLVAGVAATFALVTAASPVYAQDEGSGGGEVLCDLHDPRNVVPAGIAAATDGSGWYIVSSAEGQDSTLSIERVGDDCNPRTSEEVFIDHTPLDPRALAVDAQGFLWVGDTGGASERDWITVNQISLDDYSNNVVFRYVFPDTPVDVESFIIPDSSDKKPLFFSATDGETTLFYPSGENQAEDTPLEEVGTVALSEGGAVTGAALNSDGTKVALRTESAVYEWTVADGDVIASITGSDPVVTPITESGTSAGISYDADGNFNVLTATDGSDGSYGTITSYTPEAAATSDESASEDAAASGSEDEGKSLLDRILDLGFGTIVKILAAIAIVGMLVMIIGIVVIRKHRKANREEEDDGEVGFAREEGFAKNDSYLGDDDPVDLGLDSGQPDPDLGQVARGNVYGGAAKQEPSGNVYGGGARQEPAGPARQEPAGNVYGAGGARQEPSGNVYGGGGARREPAGPSYGGGREEPQYGAFEGGGHGSVYDNAGPGQSFAARPEPGGDDVYGGGGGGARQEPSGNVYGAAQQQGQGAVYGAGNAERTPEAEDGYWGPPEGGTTYGRGR